MIVGISGRMGSGKDTVAEIIKRQFKDKNFEIISFADPLKNFCVQYLGLSYDDVYTQEGKMKFNEFWNMTNREILQKVGTDALRNGFDKDVWVKIMELHILNNSQKNFIIPDVRFDNEAELVNKHSGIMLNIVRDCVNKDTHVSEKGISKELILFNINNNKTFYDLESEVCWRLREFFESAW